MCSCISSALNSALATPRAAEVGGPREGQDPEAIPPLPPRHEPHSTGETYVSCHAIAEEPSAADSRAVAADPPASIAEGDEAIAEWRPPGGGAVQLQEDELEATQRPCIPAVEVDPPFSRAESDLCAVSPLKRPLQDDVVVLSPASPDSSVEQPALLHVATPSPSPEDVSPVGVLDVIHRLGLDRRLPMGMTSRPLCGAPSPSRPDDEATTHVVHRLLNASLSFRTTQPATVAASLRRPQRTSPRPRAEPPPQPTGADVVRSAWLCLRGQHLMIYAAAASDGARGGRSNNCAVSLTDALRQHRAPHILVPIHGAKIHGERSAGTAVLVITLGAIPPCQQGLYHGAALHSIERLRIVTTEMEGCLFEAALRIHAASEAMPVTCSHVRFPHVWTHRSPPATIPEGNFAVPRVANGTLLPLPMTDELGPFSPVPDTLTAVLAQSRRFVSCLPTSGVCAWNSMFVKVLARDTTSEAVDGRLSEADCAQRITLRASRLPYLASTVAFEEQRMLTEAVDPRLNPQVVRLCDAIDAGALLDFGNGSKCCAELTLALALSHAAGVHVGPLTTDRLLLMSATKRRTDLAAAHHAGHINITGVGLGTPLEYFRLHDPGFIEALSPVYASQLASCEPPTTALWHVQDDWWSLAALYFQLRTGDALVPRRASSWTTVSIGRLSHGALVARFEDHRRLSLLDEDALEAWLTGRLGEYVGTFRLHPLEAEYILCVATGKAPPSGRHTVNAGSSCSVAASVLRLRLFDGVDWDAVFDQRQPPWSLSPREARPSRKLAEPPEGIPALSSTVRSDRPPSLQYAWEMVRDVLSAGARRSSCQTSARSSRRVNSRPATARSSASRHSSVSPEGGRRHAVSPLSAEEREQIFRRLTTPRPRPVPPSYRAPSPPKSDFGPAPPVVRATRHDAVAFFVRDAAGRFAPEQPRTGVPLPTPRPIVEPSPVPHDPHSRGEGSWSPSADGRSVTFHPTANGPLADEAPLASPLAYGRGPPSLGSHDSFFSAQSASPGRREES